MTNSQKRVCVFLAMIGGMVLCASFSFETYRQILFFFGAFCVGRDLSAWSQAKWPTS